MLLLNPKKLTRSHPDAKLNEILRKTVDFFETKGKKSLKEDDLNRVWYTDFLEFIKREKIFATLLTPEGYGAADCRWGIGHPSPRQRSSPTRCCASSARWRPSPRRFATDPHPSAKSTAACACRAVVANTGTSTSPGPSSSSISVHPRITPRAPCATSRPTTST